MRTTTAPLVGPERLEDRDVPAAPFTELPILPAFDAATLANVRAIAEVGDRNGLRDDVFIKVGDSNTSFTEFLQRLGAPDYNPYLSGLANFGADLVQTWQKYRAPVDATGQNSFQRTGSAAVSGTALPQMLANTPREVAVARGSVALVLAGTNDHYSFSAAAFKANLTQLAEQLTAAGVVPVLSTIPWDRYLPGRDPEMIAYNQAIAEVADELKLPVINLWRAVEPLPNNGLLFTNPWVGRDYRHLSWSSDSGRFLPFDLLYGQNVRNLLTVQVLTQLRQLVLERPADTPVATWSPLSAGQAVFAAGDGRGGTVTVFDADSGVSLGRLVPYGPGFRGGVSAAVGDVNGDGVPDVVTAPASGGGPHVRAFSGTDGSELFGFFALDPGFTGGVSLAVGDVDRDGSDDIVIGAGNGGGPVVRVFRAADRAVVSEFMAFDPAFRGGVTVAAGSFGVAVGAGRGGGPLVRVFDPVTGAMTNSFAAYDLNLRTGVSVAAGDLDGDGTDELLTAPLAGGAPHVRAFDAADGADRGGFFAGAVTESTGLTVTALGGAGDGLRIAVGTRSPSNTPVRLGRFGEALAAAPVPGDSFLFTGAYVG